jgi:hypothetical protein
MMAITTAMLASWIWAACQGATDKEARIVCFEDKVNCSVIKDGTILNKEQFTLKCGGR